MQISLQRRSVIFNKKIFKTIQKKKIACDYYTLGQIQSSIFSVQQLLDPRFITVGNRFSVLLGNLQFLILLKIFLVDENLSGQNQLCLSETCVMLSKCFF